MFSLNQWIIFILSRVLAQHFKDHIPKNTSDISDSSTGVGYYF